MIHPDESPEDRRQVRWTGAWIALAILVLYPLSSAPVLRLSVEFAADLSDSGWHVPSWWNTFYQPVLSVSDHPPLRGCSDAWFDGFGVGERHRTLRKLRRINTMLKKKLREIEIRDP